MRLSELRGCEVINLANGERLGPFGDADFLIDARTGQIEHLLLPHRRGWLSRGEAAVPWSAVRRIGPEVILLETERDPEPQRGPARR
jgi:YlmC/YmxH family sporulation protein